MKNNFIFFVSLIFIILFFFVFYYKNTSEGTEQNAIDNGNHIIKALEKYHDDYGNYPKKLSELVPTYINKIPDPKLSNGLTSAKFYYHRYENQDKFFLSFKYDIFSEFYYKSDKKEWIYTNH